jgi:hypothetical protein
MTAHRRHRTPFTAVAAALALGLALLLAGCGSGGGSSSGTSAPGAQAGSRQDGTLSKPVQATPGPAAGDSSGGEASTGFADSSAAGSSASKAASSPRSASSALTADALTTQRVRTAQVTVKARDLGAAAAQIRAAADRLGGSVSSEQSQSAASGGDGQDVLTLRVPEPKLDDAITAVTATGTELSRITSSDDVTAALADLESRERSQQASVDRVRALMAKASTLQDVVLLESELSRRETDLEAAQASRRALADQAAQATLTVTLTTGTAPAPEPQPDKGFVAGLHRSWHAVQVSTTVLLTVLGALLPVGLALAVIGWPAYLLTRRLRARRPAPTTP